MIYEGNVSWVESKDGSFKLMAKATGKWNATNSKDMVKTLIEKKALISQWALFVEINSELVKFEAPLKPAEFAALIKDADTVELMLVRRPWPHPRLRISKGSKSKTTSKSSGRREI
jgi:hypothetical protein